MARSRHHYIPQCYLKRWANKTGKVACLLADEDNKIVETAPINLGFQRYYYSQPTEDGGQENDILEDFFSKAESKFSKVADKILNDAKISKAEFHSLMNFVSAMHARVPAMRDCIKQFLASGVAAVAKQLDEKGGIPRHPETGESIIHAAQISIDPHRSLHAMAHLVKDFGKLLGRLGFCILKNETKLPFLTSDNPVVLFDMTAPDTPFITDGSAFVALFFAIDPYHLLYGTSEFLAEFQESGRPWTSSCNTLKQVRMFNEKIAQFGYRQIYATTKAQLDNYKAYSATSPIIETIWLEQNGSLVPIRNWAFKKRPKLPKWKGRGPDL